MPDLKTIARSLGIDVPILATRQRYNQIELFLYGGATAIFTLEQTEPGSADEVRIATSPGSSRQGQDLNGKQPAGLPDSAEVDYGDPEVNYVDPESMTARQLRKLGKELGIKGATSARKGDLIAAIRKVRPNS